MINLENCVATWVIIYFIPIVFIGAFFLLNLTLAVIKSKFTEEHKSKKTFKKKKKKVIMKKRGIDESSNEEGEDGQGGQEVLGKIGDNNE
jgi:predicted membrane protein